jgi:hypothetical protein
MKLRTCVALLSVFLMVVFGVSYAAAQTATDKPAPKEGVLKAADVGAKLFPTQVFFRGLVASVQARNSGGVRFGDNFLVMAALVDNSGYSTGLKEKYQAYLINEVAIEIGGQTLKPGAYGFGFIEGDKFVVMDLGANDIFQVSSTKDAELKHPVPLQFVAGSTAGAYRLYKGRDYVEFKRAK